MVIEIKKHVLWKFNLNCLRDKIPKMAGPQVCPDFSAQPIGFESACTPFLIFIFAIILTFGLLIFEILNEKCFSNRISSTKKAKTLMKVEQSQRIIEKNQSILKFLKHVMTKETEI